MKPSLASLLVVIACGVAPGAFAQTAAPTPVTGEPQVKHVVIEDDGARIEELRVRGVTTRIVVTPKGGAKPYEIIPLDAARDQQFGPKGGRGAAGQRVWNVLNF
jgi:hypothetical protein